MIACPSLDDGIEKLDELACCRLLVGVEDVSDFGQKRLDVFG